MAAIPSRHRRFREHRGARRRAIPRRPLGRQPVPARRLPQPVGAPPPASLPAATWAWAASSTITGSRRFPGSAATYSPGARSRRATRGSSRLRHQRVRPRKARQRVPRRRHVPRPVLFRLWPRDRRRVELLPPPRAAAVMNQAANAHWLARSRRAVWHPCTQMKVHETLPLVPIARGEGAWLYDFDGRRYLDAVELVVGQPLRPRESAHQRRARGAARRARARDARRLHARAGGRALGASRRARAGRPRPRVLRLRRRLGDRDRAQDGVPLLEEPRPSGEDWISRASPAATTARRSARSRSPTCALFRDTYAPLLRARLDRAVSRRARRARRASRRATSPSAPRARSTRISPRITRRRRR